MANSIVKVTDAVLNDSLLLLVGEDGTVTPDRDTVENYLNSKTGATDIRLMHINKTDKKGVDISVDNLTYIPDVVNEVEFILPINKEGSMDEIARNLYSFRLDHDYTQLFSPHGIEGTETILAGNETIFENENIEKEEVGDLPEPPCMSRSVGNETSSESASTSSTPASNKTKQIVSAKSPSKQPDKSKLKEKPRIVQQIEEEFDEDFDKDDDSENDDEDEEEYDYEDDENDSDFEIRDASKLKQPKWQKIKRRKSQSSVTKSPRVKHETKKEQQKVKEIKNKLQETATSQEQPVKIEKPIESTEKDKTAEKKPFKKEKKPPKPIPNDFALFSTPDIIRKVVKEPQTPEPLNTSPAKISNENRSKSSETVPKSNEKSNRLSLDGKTTSTPLRVDVKIRDRRVSSEKSRKNSIDEKLKSPVTASVTTKELIKKTEKSLQSISSNEDLSLDPMPTPEDIRSIIMTEDVKTFTTSTLPLIQTSEISSTESSNVEPNLSLDSSALDIDQSILDNINNDEISEDILYQVAQQLVGNTDLQNAIEKGLNEGNLVLDPSIQDSMAVQAPTQTTSSNNIQQEESETKKGTQIVRPDGRVVVIPPIERPTTRSRNKRNSEVTPKKPSIKLDSEHVSGNELDSSEEEDNQEEEESEDDPNKLWCICNQPHNNRFMICCDTCEEWYHGKCVNITKSMGQQMEEEGKEWICLFCKDPSLKRPKAAARRIRKASKASTDSAESSKKQEKAVSSNKITCVVCQKPARENSIYCSQSCILAHASHVERVVVFERSSGKMLSGSKAPSSNNLEQWLKEHPTFEVYRSGGKIVTAKVKPKQPQTNMVQSKLKLVKNTDDQGVSLEVRRKGIKVGILKHAPKNIDGKNGDRSAKPTAIRSDPVPTKFYAKTATPPGMKKTEIAPSRPLKFTPPTPTNKPKLIQTTLKPTVTSPKDKSQPLKTPKSRQAEQQATPKQENIRENVQKTLFEQLTNRLKLDGNLKLTEDEVKEISTEIESQLYKCFGDTGQKYRNKYRSLIFNIKDIKNQTLWKRICEKSINAYQLVRLSPDDLASQELALWREREAKHSLDMIKKSELELLNCSRQYVLKTHKGEQVVDETTRTSEKIDNIEVIRTLTEDNSSDGKDSKSSDNGKDSKKTSKHKDRKSSKDRDHKKRRRSSSKERDRSRRRSSSKERGSSSSKKEKRRSRSRDRHRKSSSSHKSSKHKKETLISTTEKLDKKSKEILEQLVDNKIVPPLEDRLWKHVPQEDMVPEPIEDSDSDHEPSSTVTIPTPPHNLESEDQVAPSEKNVPSKPSQEIVAKEPEVERSMSPPLPRKPPSDIWKGTISMIDVAHIKISAVEVSGDCSDLGDQLPPNLDIVGRISPDTVWDYIGKMKCSNSKIISLVRLNAINVEEKMQYLALYSYLSSRKRLGVVKSTNKAIKDFYILPLASQKPIPQALLPINGPGFEESRPALLLGIIVRDRRKRGAALDSSLQYTTTPKKSRISTPPLPGISTGSADLPATVQPSRSYTPPSTATPSTSTVNKDPRLKLAMPLPSPNIPSPTDKELDDGDEPYSPEDSDPDNTVGQNFLETSSITPSYSTYAPTIPGLDVVPDLPASTLEIQKQMEELNKKIEAQKSEIHNISKNIVSASSEIGPSALANIALPSNLQQILDSIKTISTEPATVEETSSPAVTKQSDTNLTIPLLLPQKFSRPIINTSIPPPTMSSPNLDFPTNTIPLNLPTRSKMKFSTNDSPQQGSDSPGLLSSLSEEELMKKAAEMLGETDLVSPVKEKPKQAPPPLLLSYSTSNTENSPLKRQKLDNDQSFDIEPPIPGIDN